MHSLPLYTLTEDVPKNSLTEAFLLLYSEREQISLKVVQTLGNDKVQVGLTFFFSLLCDDGNKSVMSPVSCLTVMRLLVLLSMVFLS